jgi:hypothetical protein
VADNGGAVADFDVGVRQLARANALDEIAHVRRAFSRTFPGGIGRALMEFRTIRLEASAQDLHLAIGALEDGAELLVIVDLGLLEPNLGATCVDQYHLVLFPEHEFHGSGEGRTERSLHLIERVRSPAGLDFYAEKPISLTVQEGQILTPGISTGPPMK